MRARALSLLPAVCALSTLCPCGSSAQIRRSVEVVPGHMMQVVVDTIGTPYRVPFPRAQVFQVLLAVFKELKVPMVAGDSAAGRVSAPTFHREGDFAGRQLSTWLSCGDSMTGPNADSYRIYMYLTATVSAEGADASSLRSALLAGAVSVSEGSRQEMPCESTGRLEVRIHQMVMKKAAGL